MSSNETSTDQPHPHPHTLTERVEEGEVDTLDTKARYLAYATRLKTAVSASTRYLAYSSDIGESFRPIISPALVKTSYLVSWGYILADMSYEGYKSKHLGESNQEVALSMVHRGAFQAVASMLFPMITIHTAVKYTARAFKNVKNITLRTWGPTSIGLMIVPALPYMFDEPVEKMMDRIFEPLKVMAKKESRASSVVEEKKTQ